MAKIKGIIISAFALFLTLFLILTSVASAENVTFVKEYIYQASDLDSKVSSRSIALEQVKRTLLEQLGIYLVSDTEIKNYQITKDQITTITAGIVSAEIIDEKWDGRTYYLKSRITADPQEIAKAIVKIRDDKQRTTELEDARRRAETALKEIEKLKSDLAIAKVTAQQQARYNLEITKLTAGDWFERGVALFNVFNNQGSIDAFTKVIELEPGQAPAFIKRGSAYSILGNYQSAIMDCNRAIELDSKSAVAYEVRGGAYFGLGQDQLAIRDLDRAIELYPKYSEAYGHRGTVYLKLGNDQQAIKDYSNAIELQSKNAAIYWGRGVAFFKLGEIRKAIKDYDKAIELLPKEVIELYPKEVGIYADRGDAYVKLNNYEQAIKDFNKALELKPNDLKALNKRGYVNQMLGNADQV